MTAEGGGRQLYLAAAVILAAVVVSASVLYAASPSRAITKTETSTLTTTLTATPTGSVNVVTYTAISTLAVTSTETTTLTVTPTSSPGTTIPFVFLTTSAICTASGGYAPCWGSPPYVFHCTTTSNLLSGPPTTQQCTQKVTSTIPPYPSYNITITTIPYASQSGVPSWVNCQWSVAGISPGQGYGYCIVISSTSTSASFVLGEQAPPHP